jgi:hypothetical protein
MVASFGTFAAISLFVDDFQSATEAFLGAAHQQQSADGIHGRALAADDLPHIGGMHAQFVNGRAIPVSRGDVHGVRPVHEAFNHIIQKGFHKVLSAGDPPEWRLES